MSGQFDKALENIYSIRPRASDIHGVLNDTERTETGLINR